jgi:hypothetical protein
VKQIEQQAMNPPGRLRSIASQAMLSINECQSAYHAYSSTLQLMYRAGIDVDQQISTL